MYLYADTTTAHSGTRDKSSDHTAGTVSKVRGMCRMLYLGLTCYL